MNRIANVKHHSNLHDILLVTHLLLTTENCNLLISCNSCLLDLLLPTIKNSISTSPSRHSWWFNWLPLQPSKAHPLPSSPYHSQPFCFKIWYNNPDMQITRTTYSKIVSQWWVYNRPKLKINLCCTPYGVSTRCMASLCIPYAAITLLNLWGTNHISM